MIPITQKSAMSTARIGNNVPLIVRKREKRTTNSTIVTGMKNRTKSPSMYCTYLVLKTGIPASYQLQSVSLVIVPILFIIASLSG